MSGLCNPPEREASLRHLERMDWALQPGPTSYVAGTGRTQADSDVTRVTTVPSSPDAKRPGRG